MSKTTKILLIVVGVIILFCVLSCAAMMALGFFTAAGQEEAVRAGQLVGERSTQQDCQEQAWKRAGECSTFAFTCPMEVQGFFTGCLQSATETPGFCEGIPEAGDEPFSYGIKIGKFAQEECANLKASRFGPRDPSVTPNQQACGQVIQARAFSCVGLAMPAQ